MGVRESVEEVGTGVGYNVGRGVARVGQGAVASWEEVTEIYGVGEGLEGFVPRFGRTTPTIHSLERDTPSPRKLLVAPQKIVIARIHAPLPSQTETTPTLRKRPQQPPTHRPVPQKTIKRCVVTDVRRRRRSLIDAVVQRRFVRDATYVQERERGPKLGLRKKVLVNVVRFETRRFESPSDVETVPFLFLQTDVDACGFRFVVVVVGRRRCRLVSVVVSVERGFDSVVTPGRLQTTYESEEAVGRVSQMLWFGGGVQTRFQEAEVHEVRIGEEGFRCRCRTAGIGGGGVGRRGRDRGRKNDVHGIGLHVVAESVH